MTRFLLIGGSGHLGYALVNEILNVLNLDQICITILTRKKSLPVYFPNNKKISFKKYNPNDINTIKTYIHEIKPSTIIYLSSDNDNTEFADVFKSSEVNLFLPIKILLLIKEINSDIKYIFLSSSLSNLKSSKSFIYSINKNFAEQYIDKFSERFQLNSNVILLPSLFGPGDLSKRRLVSSYMQSLINKSDIEIQQDFRKNLTIVYSKEVAKIFLKKIFTNNFQDFYDSINLKKFLITIGDLLEIIDLIHESKNDSNELDLKVKYIANSKNVKNYEILYTQLLETYDFYKKQLT